MSVALLPTKAVKPPPNPLLKRRAVRGGALYLAARLGTQIVAWTVTLLVARLLSPFDYGLMSAGLVVIGLADLLAEAGIGRALVQRSELCSQDLSQAFTVNLLLSAALYGLVCLSAHPIAAILQLAEFTVFLPVLALVLWLIPFRAIPLALLDRELRLGKQSAVHVVTAIVQAGCVLGLALAGMGYWALVAGALAARVLEAAALLWLAGWTPRLAMPGAAAWSLLRFGVPASAASLLWFFYSNADFAVIEAVLGTITLGYYALAFQLMALPAQKLTASVNQVAYAVFCRMTNNREQLRNGFLRLVRMVALVGLPALAGLILVAEDAFLVLFGPKWLPAVTPFQMLAGAGMIMLIATSFPSLYNALGRPGINVRYTAACALLLPPCFIGGVLMGGLPGVCLAWLIVYPTIVLILIARTRNLTGIGLMDVGRAVGPILSALGAMIPVVLVIQVGLGEWPSGPRLTITVISGVLTYIAWLIGFSRTTVLADMADLWRELRARKPSLKEAVS